MSKTTDVFKNTVVIVVGEAESEAVQKAMFALGFFPLNDRGMKRRVMNIPYARNGGQATIFVDENCEMSFGVEVNYPSTMPITPRLIGKDELFAAVVVHKAERKAKKKASKKRKQLLKQGWIIHSGSDMPVSPSTQVQIMFDDYSFYEADDTKFADEATWRQGKWDTVFAYKTPFNTTVVSQQEMVDDIVKSAGGVEIDPQVVTLEEMIIETQTPTGYQTGERIVPARRVADTNPKKQFGDKSIPLNLWPALASAYGALGLYNGKLKYGLSNFNATPVEASIYIAGAMRHLAAWAEGEEFDPADGVPNLGGVLANIAIILEARAAGTLIDDRKMGNGYLKEREALKAIVAALQVLHADKAPYHYTIQDAK